jgi:hypothetical protein
MPKLLYVRSSPRHEDSVSSAIGDAFVDAYRQRHHAAAVDELDVWSTLLPEFDGPTLAAKYAGIGGKALSAEQATAWETIRALASRFQAADVIVLGVPAWNRGIPYKLKHIIDDVLRRVSCSTSMRAARTRACSPARPRSASMRAATIMPKTATFRRRNSIISARTSSYGSSSSASPIAARSSSSRRCTDPTRRPPLGTGASTRRRRSSRRCRLKRCFVFSASHSAEIGRSVS